jgi:hypothetical protein
MNTQTRDLTPGQCEEILGILKDRFEHNRIRHAEYAWTEVHTRLVANQDKLWSLYEMERTGGEPDLISFDHSDGEFIFYDCSAESPKGRRNVCYDREALEARKTNKPENSALDLAFVMGIEILTEEQYRKLQEKGAFDTKTSSWVKTPDKIRKLGGAIFCDRRYDNVFVYHNGAESYYSSRGFRGLLKV